LRDEKARFEMDLSVVASGIADICKGIAASAIFEYLKNRFGGRSEITGAELQEAIGDFLVLHGVRAEAATVMTLLASKGYIEVTGSQLHANEKLVIAAASGAKFTVGQNTRTTTEKTAIEAGHGAYMSGSGAAVVQNDGSISFHTGGDPPSRAK
jgi:hypothetical protein